MDKLKESAKAFALLFDKEYHIKAGRKGKIIEFTINFKKSDFFHLAGLHKLKDISSLVSASASKEDIFDKILNEEITYEQLSKSVYFENVKGRIENLSRLELLLDQGQFVFKFCQQKVKGCFINADYVFYFDNSFPEVYFFIVERNDEMDRFTGTSFFQRQDDKYIARQTKYTVLYISKKDVLTSEEIILKDNVIK